MTGQDDQTNGPAAAGPPPDADTGMTALPPRARIHGEGSRAGGLLASPGFKFIIIGIISVMLMVPALMVWGLAEERAERAREVSGRIAQGWGGRQVLNGPYIAIPAPKRTLQMINGREVLADEPNWVLVMPETLSVEADLGVEERRLSIYALPVYQSKIRIKGRFAPGDIAALAGLGGNLRLSEAALVVSMSDIAGIRSDATIALNGGEKLDFSPGLRGLAAPPPQDPVGLSYHQDAMPLASGIHRTIDLSTLEAGFDFVIEFTLNGSRSFAVAPAGQTTSLAVKANWPHPGFGGVFLPDTKTIAADGFSAAWTIPFLARGIDSRIEGRVLPLAESAMSVNLVEPVQFYQMVARTLKYAIGILSLVFLAVFVMELRTGKSVHWIQYVLSGLAMIIFYILLLALAEHLGFAIAYVIAAAAVTGQVSFYLGSVTRSLRTGLTLAGLMAVIYGILYLILREDEYALLAGAIVAFLAIGATMMLTVRSDFAAAPPRPVQP